MKITKVSPFSGIEHTLDLPNLSEIQLSDYEASGQPIQIVLAQLTPDEREFIMTGITAEEWDDAFGTEEV